MKQLRILAVYGKYKSHKEVTFEVPEEVANHFSELTTGEINGKDEYSFTHNHFDILTTNITQFHNGRRTWLAGQTERNYTQLVSSRITNHAKDLNALIISNYEHQRRYTRKHQQGEGTCNEAERT